jgi:hypothetical protein
MKHLPLAGRCLWSWGWPPTLRRSTPRTGNFVTFLVPTTDTYQIFALRRTVRKRHRGDLAAA